MIELKNNPAGNFFLLAGPCVIEGEEMAMRIAERVVGVTEKLQIPYVFKGSYRKANCMASGERNCPFLMLIVLPVLAAATSKSV